MKARTREWLKTLPLFGVLIAVYALCGIAAGLGARLFTFSSGIGACK